MLWRTVEISLFVQNWIPPENIGIIFEDTGPGIDDALKAKIFNLYFTTKAKGTGIGLSIVQRIISEHNGVINMINNKNGTTFKIILPIRLTMQG